MTSQTSPTADERRPKLIDDYKAHFANLYAAAERGYIDDIIEPHQTRPKLIRALRTLQTKRVEQPKRNTGAESEEQCLKDVRYLIELPAAQQPRAAAAGRAVRRPRADG